MFRLLLATTLSLGALLGAGCATTTRSSATAPVTKPMTEAMSGLSPAPLVVPAHTAGQLAEDYVRGHPGSDYVIGRGDSMLPRYRSQTVLVTERVPLSQLRRGMTVVFIGDSGLPVAHTLGQKTPHGWIAYGLGNNSPDDTYIREGNYLGTVVKAYEPTEIALAGFDHDDEPPPPLAYGQ